MRLGTFKLSTPTYTDVITSNSIPPNLEILLNLYHVTIMFTLLRTWESFVIEVTN